ncbi:hypothetical protein JQN63_00160 [Delftia lacustris]|nr:hypothetical protein JQN63_00160 [Delftia lacustris]
MESIVQARDLRAVVQATPACRMARQMRAAPAEVQSRIRRRQACAAGTKDKGPAGSTPAGPVRP